MSAVVSRISEMILCVCVEAEWLLWREMHPVPWCPVCGGTGVRPESYCGCEETAVES